MAASTVVASATSSVAVSKSDSTLIEFQALYIGGAGNVVIQHVPGTSVTYTAVPAGTILPVAGTRVMDASTATSIVAMRW